MPNPGPKHHYRVEQCETNITSLHQFKPSLFRQILCLRTSYSKYRGRDQNWGTTKQEKGRNRNRTNEKFKLQWKEAQWRRRKRKTKCFGGKQSSYTLIELWPSQSSRIAHKSRTSLTGFQSSKLRLCFSLSLPFFFFFFFPLKFIYFLFLFVGHFILSFALHYSIAGANTILSSFPSSFFAFVFLFLSTGLLLLY